MAKVFRHLTDEEEARALALGDILHDCVRLYMAEIAEDEPVHVRRCAELALCKQLRKANA